MFFGNTAEYSISPCEMQFVTFSVSVSYTSKGFITVIFCCWWNLIDIDECITITPNCSHNAQCVDTLGSYQCQCTNGYAGDGYDCTGKAL